MNIKKMCSLILTATAITVAVHAEYADVPQLQSQQLKKIPTSTMIPTNLVPVINQVKDNLTYLKGTSDTFGSKLKYLDADSTKVFLGYPAYNEGSTLTSINIVPYWKYPSYTYGLYTINLGIDNLVGYDTSTEYNKYSVAIGTSVKIAKQHGYVLGSQANIFEQNATVIGYGGSAVHAQSTVIGHGRRPNGGGSSYDKKFTSWSEADAFLKTLSANIFRGVHFEVKTSDSTNLYTITEVRSSPDANGYYYDYLETPDTGEYGDYTPGQYDWRYGKSHGKGTFNIVAVDPAAKVSPGLRGVYINDDCLYDLVTGVAGVNTVKRLTLTPTQISKGVTFVKDGYDQNEAIEIGDDATASLSQSYVSSLNSPTVLRNVSVAIGARANATNPSNKGTAQAIAIGYCANADGGQSIAIGPGAKHLTDETDLTGHNAYAHGGTSIAIGYSTKATGSSSVAIGSGQGGHTMASSSNTVAIGRSAQATAVGAVQLGTGVNDEPNTLKFQGTTIVRNGKVTGFDEHELDPKEHILEPPYTGVEITAKAHVINSLTFTSNVTVSAEIAVSPAERSKRNYEIFIDNDEFVREGLPLNLQTDELPTGISAILKCPDIQEKLPLMITVRQPTSKRVIINAEYMPDSFTNWNPVVTNCAFVYDAVTKSLSTPTGAKTFLGTSIHCATNIVLTFGDGASAKTRVIPHDPNDYQISGTFYGYATIPSIALTAEEDSTFNGPQTGSRYLGVEYMTKRGTFTKQFIIDCNEL